MELNGRVWMVTGGASGLGAATVRAAVASGGRVMIVDRDAERGEQLASELGEAARFTLCDVTDEASVAAAVAATVAAFGQIDVLVNCAGVAPAEKLVGRKGPHDLAIFERTVAINLTGTFNTMRLVAAHMVNNPPNEGGERGVIINTASIAAFEGQIGQIAYAASKGGIVAMTLPAARELARSGVRVMTIAPGIMETPMLLGMPAEVQASLHAMVPFPSRMGKPAEYAALVQAIVTNPYLNGETIRLDGAIRMGAK
jgi:NAD(P)-dependent dehydrogenase (short-subunit alcohol dehydrogenase family)